MNIQTDRFDRVKNLDPTRLDPTRPLDISILFTFSATLLYNEAS